MIQLMRSTLLIPRLILPHSNKSFSTTSTFYSKRNFRKFPLYNKRGTLKYKASKTGVKPDYLLGVRGTGYEKDNEYIITPEMIPDIIVPDLTDFNLKPYVSYRVPKVVQSAFTANDLFYAVYSRKIADDFKNNKLDADGNPVEPSPEEKLTPDDAWIKARQTGSDLFCAEPVFKNKTD